MAFFEQGVNHAANLIWNDGSPIRLAFCNGTWSEGWQSLAILGTEVCSTRPLVTSRTITPDSGSEQVTVTLNWNTFTAPENSTVNRIILFRGNTFSAGRIAATATNSGTDTITIGVDPVTVGLTVGSQVAIRFTNSTQQVATITAVTANSLTVNISLTGLTAASVHNLQGIPYFNRVLSTPLNLSTASSVNIASTAFVF